MCACLYKCETVTESVSLEVDLDLIDPHFGFRFNDCKYLYNDMFNGSWMFSTERLFIILTVELDVISENNIDSFFPL